MKYRVIVFDAHDTRICTEEFEASGEIAADAEGYRICFQTPNGNSYDVQELPR